LKQLLVTGAEREPVFLVDTTTKLGQIIAPWKLQTGEDGSRRGRGLRARLRLPLIGTLRAAGFTAPALENAIAGALAQGYLKNPRVNVEITAYRPFYVMGAVNRPGNYPYVNNMSALDAVALGGGFTDQARQSVVYVRHEGSTVEEELPANQLTRIWPGDVVRVKDTLFWDAMAIFTPLAGPAALAAAAVH